MKKLFSLLLAAALLCAALPVLAQDAIVITDNAILSKDGLRYEDEFVRHKVMDLIGDLALTGRRLKAHVISSRSGHTLNNKAAAALFALANKN